jgi:hypothetical protein
MCRYTWRQLAYIGAISGCIEFFVLTICAMVVYPGSTHTDYITIGYNFWQNFFSDLGGTATPSGASNPIASVLFFIALTSIGILFIPFLAALPGIFSKSRVARYIGFIGSAIGMYSAICYVGIAFTPWNLAITGHIFFVQNAFVSIVPVALCYAIAMILEKGFPKQYPVIFIIFSAILVAYVVLLFSGPGAGSPEGIIIQAVGQKIVVYSMIICFAIQAYGALQVSLRKPVASS